MQPLFFANCTARGPARSGMPQRQVRVCIRLPAVTTDRITDQRTHWLSRYPLTHRYRLRRANDPRAAPIPSLGVQELCRQGTDASCHSDSARWTRRAASISSVRWDATAPILSPRRSTDSKRTCSAWAFETLPAPASSAHRTTRIRFLTAHQRRRCPRDRRRRSLSTR